MKSKLANRAALGLALVAAMAVAATARADDQGGALPANPAPFAQVNPGAMNQDELLACANTQIDVDARMSEVESRRQALEARQARFDEEVSLLADDVARFNADRKRSKERAEELKRRGMAAVDGLLEQGPVQIVKNNQPRYVVMSQADFETLTNDLAEARLAASEADLKNGRIRKGTAAELLAELRKAV